MQFQRRAPHQLPCRLQLVSICT